MRTHMSWVAGNILSPVPAGSALASAASVQLVVIATRAHWCLVFKFPVRTHPKGFLCKLPSNWPVFSSLYWCMGLFFVKHNKFVLADRHEGLVTHFFALSRSLWIAAIPISILTTGPSWISPVNSIWCTLPSLKLLVKVLSNIVPALTGQQCYS